MNSPASTPLRLSLLMRLLFGGLAVLLLSGVALEVAVQGLVAWKFIVAASGFGLLFLFQAVTGRRFWWGGK